MVYKRAESDCRRVRVVSSISFASQLENCRCWVDAGQMPLITSAISLKRYSRVRPPHVCRGWSSSTSAENGKDERIWEKDYFSRTAAVYPSGFYSGLCCPALE